MTETTPDPEATNPRPDAGPPAGGESYSLEVPADDVPLGAEPESDAEPCPSCGAPRRVPGPTCLRCGWNEAGTDSTAADASAVSARSRATTDEAGDAVPGESWDDDPLARPWPISPAITRSLAIGLVGLTVLAGLLGTAVFPPGPVAARVDGDGIGFLLRLGWIVRVLLVTGAWWAAIAGSFAVIAWTEDRPFGAPGTLVARAAIVAATARLAILLPMADPAPAFVVEGLLFLALGFAGVLASIRVPARIGLAVIGGGLVVVSGIGAVGRLVGWAILG